MSKPDELPLPIRIVQGQLRVVAEVLRDVHPLTPELQHLLAGLTAELSDALDEPDASPEKLSHLTESMARLAQALHQDEERHLLPGLRNRLERAVADIEGHYPNLAGLARRMLDALAGIGI